MSRNKTIYLTPAGKTCSLNELKRISESQEGGRSPWMLEQFENSRVRVTLSGIQRLIIDGTVPPEHWMRFSIDVHNILTTDIEGNPIPKVYSLDVSGTRKFRTLEEAKAEYQLFLARYTESEFNAETGEFIERGNMLSPDVPRPADEPSSKVSATDFGSW